MASVGGFWTNFRCASAVTGFGCRPDQCMPARLLSHQTATNYTGGYELDMTMDMDMNYWWLTGMD